MVSLTEGSTPLCGRLFDRTAALSATTARNAKVRGPGLFIGSGRSYARGKPPAAVVRDR